MKVAILFERSGIVRDAFLSRGHDAISCDIEPSDRPGPHIQGDVFDYDWSGYDLIIAHPPCTYIAVSGNRYYAGTAKRQEAADLIARVWDIPVDHMCIENPVGQINKYLPFMPKPQYIQPYQFGHDASKKTGLWLRGVPPLEPTHIVEPDYICSCGCGFEAALGKYGCPNCCGDSGPARGVYANQTPSGQNKLGPSPDRAAKRAETYPGIARAMSKQWGRFLKGE